MVKYKTSRWDSEIEEIKVIAKAPKIKTRTTCDGENSIIFTVTFDEVID